MSEEQKNQDSSVLIGIISCVLSTLGIFTWGIIFVPMAFVVAIFGTVSAFKNSNLTGVGISILAWLLNVIGFASSPFLLAVIWLPFS